MRGVRGAEPTIAWSPPISCCTQLKMTLDNKQLPLDDDRRFVTTILRAQPFFYGRPAYNDIKVWIEEDAGRRLYFARFVMKNFTMYFTMIVMINFTMFVMMNFTMYIMTNILHYFRCQAFFKDSLDEHYVAVRWYAQTRTTPPGVVLELPCLNVAPENRTDSYSVLHVECIVNGAVLFWRDGYYWAIQSPREEYAYNRNELAFQM